MLLDVNAPSDFVIKRYLSCTVFVHSGSKQSQTESYISNHAEAHEVNNLCIIQPNTGIEEENTVGSLFVLHHKVTGKKMCRLP